MGRGREGERERGIREQSEGKRRRAFKLRKGRGEEGGREGREGGREEGAGYPHLHVWVSETGRRADVNKLMFLVLKRGREGGR